MDKDNLGKKKKLVEKVKKLKTTEHKEIFFILSKKNIVYSKNNNGIFINLKDVNDDVLDEIINFVDFSFRNNKELDTYEKDKLILKDTNKFENSQDDCSDSHLILYKNEKKMIEDENNLILNIFEKSEKVKKISKKISEENQISYKKKVSCRYNTARKKYSKPIITQLKKKESVNILEKNNYLIKN